MPKPKHIGEVRGPSIVDIAVAYAMQGNACHIFDFLPEGDPNGYVQRRTSISINHLERMQRPDMHRIIGTLFIDVDRDGADQYSYHAPTPVVIEYNELNRVGIAVEQVPAFARTESGTPHCNVHGPMVQRDDCWKCPHCNAGVSYR